MSSVGVESGTPAPIDHLPAGTAVGDYEIRRRIGEGGFAVVYEGEHRALKKRVAIKLLFPHHSSTDVVMRFLREGEAAARLRHPNVVDVVHVGTWNGSPYLVMEYLDGEDLGALLNRESKLSLNQLADIMIPVMSAVAAAHEADIVHRDLKPDNIFICHDRRGKPMPKVLDFGISKLSNEKVTLNLTASDAILGTPYYMSPEQAQGSRAVDSRSDIFALGVIMYEAATGKRPFEGQSLYTVLSSIVGEEPVRPSQVTTPFEEEVEDIIRRALQKQPDARFQSVREMGAALLRFASDMTRVNYAHDFMPSVAPPAPRSSSSRTTAESGHGHAAAQRPTGRPTATAGWGKRAGILAATLALGGAMAAGVLGLLRGPEAQEHPEEDAAPSTVAAAPVAPTPVAAAPVAPEPQHTVSAAPAALSRVTIVADPGDAEIRLDGVVLGTGVAITELPDDDAPHALVVEAEGYVAKTRTFVGPKAPRRVTLEPIRTARKPKRPKATAKRAATPDVEPVAPAPPPEPARPTTRRGANNAPILR